MFWDHVLVVEYVTASVLWYFETGEKAYLLVCLTSDAFDRARAEFGRAHHVGRSMPSELPKSWDYVHYAWNTFARTPVASAIESITGGDESSITFRLFGDGSKKKKTKKKRKKRKKAVRLFAWRFLKISMCECTKLLHSSTISTVTTAPTNSMA